MQVIINGVSWGKGSTARNIVPKMSGDGKSGAFLCTVHDLQGHAPFQWTTEADGEIPGRLSSAVELWFRTDMGVDGKPLAEGAVSMYHRIVQRLAECAANGTVFAMEFVPQSIRYSDPYWGNGDNQHVLYQTATVNPDRFAARRFFEMSTGAVEGL
jgi:hypothetical protein